MYNRIWFQSGISKEITSICCWKVRSFNNRLQKWILFCSWILSLWICQKCIFFAYLPMTREMWWPIYRSGFTYLEKSQKFRKFTKFHEILQWVIYLDFNRIWLIFGVWSIIFIHFRTPSASFWHVLFLLVPSLLFHLVSRNLIFFLK